MSADMLDRRGFLKALALTTTAAAAAGGGAALLLRNHQSETIISAVDPLPTTPPLPTAGLAAPAGNSNDLITRLAAAQSENVRLQAELMAAQQRVAALEAASGDTSAFNEALQAELAAANNHAGLLAGLVTLYEQMDELELGDVLQNGLAAVGEAFADLTGRVPTLEEGLTLGQQALDNFETEIPLMATGRDWLQNHLLRLETFYQAAEAVLASALESGGSFLEMLGRWFADVLKWLPFGVGDKAANVVTALTDLLQETPNTLTGLNGNVIQPLDTWLASTNGGERPLHSKLVKPLREQTLAPAGEVAAQVRTTHDTYVAQLAEPVQTTVARRQAIRQLIGQYREKYQV